MLLRGYFNRINSLKRAIYHRRRCIIACVIGALLLLGGCGGALLLTAAAGLVGVANVVEELRIAPDSPQLPVGARLRFVAIAYSKLGNPVPTYTYEWTSSNPDIGIINDDGIFEARAIGTTQIEAKAVTLTGAKSARTVVTVIQATGAPGQIVAVSILPPTLRIPVGQSFQFVATAVDSQGYNVLEPNFIFSLAGNIGELDRLTGRFTATNVGNGSVTVTAANGQSATAHVVVSGSVGSIPAALVIYPPFVYMRPGGKQQFSAILMDKDGNFVTPTGLTWTCDTTIGTINASGLFTATLQAPTTGEGIEGKVTARVGNINSTAQVVIKGTE